MSGKKSTTTQNVTIPQEVLDRYNAVNARAETTAANPFQKFGTNASDFVAQINQQQTAGINSVNEAAGSYKPYMAAGAGATMAGMGPAYEGIDRYMSPYIRNVADTTGALMRQQQEQAQSGALGTAISSGAFGGDRAGIAAANLQQQNALGYGKTMADIYNTGYTQALGASQSDLARQMAGGAQLAGIGAQTQAAGLQGAEAQIAAGGLQQQTEQAGKTALVNQFMQEQGYPFQVAQFLANIAMGTGALSGSTTKTTQPASFFKDGGRVHKEGGGGVAGPYGASVGSQPFLEGYIPQAYLPVGELMMADSALADQSAQSNADYINQMLQMGQSIRGLTAEGKAYGGGVDAPNSARSYLSDVIDSQKKEDKPDLLTARQPDGQKGGGLGETLGNVAKILSFFKDGGVVGRHGYAEGGGSSVVPESEIRRRLGLPEVLPSGPSNSGFSGGVAAIPSPPNIANLGNDYRSEDAARAASAKPVEAFPLPEGQYAPDTSMRPLSRSSAGLAAASDEVAKDTLTALGNAPSGLAPLTSPRPQQPYSAGLPSDVTGDTDFMSGVRGLSQKYRVSEGDILRLMNAESGINPSAQNSIGATGLIQFTPQTAANLGTSPEALAGMSRSEQLPFVDQYLGGTKLSGVDNPSFNDLYASVLWPAAVGKPDDTVLFSKGSEAYYGNAPLDLNQDGDVTKGEAGTWARNKGVGVSSGSAQPAGGVAGADVAAAPHLAGRKAYDDRNAIGQLLHDPSTNKLTPDAWLSILSGIGTMASSPSRFLGSAILQGVGGAASTMANLRQQAPERAAKQLENMRQVAMDTMQWNEMNGTNLTPAAYAAANGINVPFPEAATAEDILKGVYKPTTADIGVDKLGYREFQNGTVDIGGRTVPMQNDPASLQKFIIDNGWAAPETPVGRAVERAKAQLDNINASGGMTVDATGSQFQIPGYTKVGDVQSQSEANRAATADFRAAGVAAIPAIDKQMSEINKQAVIFSNLQGGALNTAKAEVMATLGAVGFEIPESVTETQQAVKIAASQMLGELGSGNLPGGAPAAELDRLKEIIADPDLQPESIKTILAMKQGMLMRERERFGLRRQWEAQNGEMSDMDQLAYEQWFAENHPFQGYYEQARDNMPMFSGEAGSQEKPFRFSDPNSANAEIGALKAGVFYYGPDGVLYKKGG